MATPSLFTLILITCPFATASARLHAPRSITDLLVTVVATRYEEGDLRRNSARLTSVSTRARTIPKWSRCVCLGQSTCWAFVKSSCQSVRCCRYRRGTFQDNCLEPGLDESNLLMRIRAVLACYRYVNTTGLDFLCLLSQ